MVAQLPAFLAQDSNEFRLKYCYKSDVNLLLKGYESSLRAIFTAYAEEREMNPGHIIDPTRISYDEWIDFCKHIAVIDRGPRFHSDSERRHTCGISSLNPKVDRTSSRA